MLLDIYKFDPDYLDNEEKYKEIKAEILGEEDDEDGSGSDSEEEDEEGSYRVRVLSSLLLIDS